MMPKSGIFTAPKTGEYFFFWMITTAHGKVCDTYFKKNGGDSYPVKVRVDDLGSHAWTTGSEMVLCPLSLGIGYGFIQKGVTLFPLTLRSRGDEFSENLYVVVNYHRLMRTD